MPPPPSRDSAARKMVGTLVIALALTLAVVVLWSRVISPKRIVDILANAPTPHHARILPYAAHARVAREYPPAFSMVTSEDAGRALHGLLIWRPESPAQAGTLLPSTQTPQDSVAILPDSNPLRHPAAALVPRRALPLAATGFSRGTADIFSSGPIADPDLRTLLLDGHRERARRWTSSAPASRIRARESELCCSCARCRPQASSPVKHGLSLHRPARARPCRSRGRRRRRRRGSCLRADGERGTAPGRRRRPSPLDIVRGGRRSHDQ